MEGSFKPFIHARSFFLAQSREGRGGANSDLDMLVVIHRGRTAQVIYRSLIGIGIAKDVVVVTESDIREHGDNPSLVLFPALREGREIYVATK